MKINTTAALPTCIIRVTLALSLFFGALVSTTEASCASKGQVPIAADFDEVIQRAEAALVAKGYTVWLKGGDTRGGYRGGCYATIIGARDSASSQVLANILVINTENNDTAACEAEQRAIAELLKKPANQAPPAFNVGGNYVENGDITTVQMRGNQIFGTYKNGSWSGTVSGNEINVTNNLGGRYKGTIEDNGDRIELHPNGGGTEYDHTLRRAR
ncbi:hypothetical protein [Prosthecobacter sp.]|uniref:hypothetical protein n=1 Tax=Prosthecobacter sp. TaxID=1965333 RepID=UPI0037848F04